METAPHFGHCRDCGIVHQLGSGNAQAHARALMREFEQIGRLDYLTPAQEADPEFGFDRLLSGERGHMFGVLECRDRGGQTVILRAFSSLPGGIRDIEGWVPQILSHASFHDVVLPAQYQIKELTRELNALPPDSPEAGGLTKRRAGVSQNLWREMQELYQFYNFRGECRSLKEAFTTGGSEKAKISSGVGECCAPMLLNHAAHTGLRPVGIAEFYWGGSNKSGSRISGEFYPCCEARCQPILGFMLCGLDDAG
jgi:hypothetical protein